MDTSRFEQFSSLMTGAAKSIAKLKAAQMEAFSLSGAHTSCLCRLYEAGSLTQGELTRAVQMDRSQVSRVLRDLAQKGYVSADAQAPRASKPSFWISTALSAVPFPTRISKSFIKR